MSSKVKIDVASLTIGMYITELDIPWLESPFMFQGFSLDNDDDIEEVRKVCQYVYVDPLQSDPAVSVKLQTLASQSKNSTNPFLGHQAPDPQSPPAECPGLHR